MKNSDDDNENRTIFCGNLSEYVDDDILYELFHQAGPVEGVRRPRDPSGWSKPFAFIIYKHQSSVPYALDLFRGTKLFNRNLNLNSRSTLRHYPVLDTHLADEDQRLSYSANTRDFQGTRSAKYDEESGRRRHKESNWRSEHDYKHDVGRDRHHTTKARDDRQHFSVDKVGKEPSSWEEFNSLRGKGSLSNCNLREDLQGPSDHRRRSNFQQLPSLPNFNALLQMGQQMMLPMVLSGPLPTGLGPGLGNSQFPSMQGKMDGGDRYLPPRPSERRNHHHHEERDNRRNHPYNDRHHDDHRRHDRGYSSSKSSHDRERRDRRSR